MVKGRPGTDKRHSRTRQVIQSHLPPRLFKDRDVFLVDDIISSGENFTQMKRKLILLGAKSVASLFLGKTVKTED